MDLKRLQLLVEALPGVSRVAVIGDPSNQSWEPAASALGIQLLAPPFQEGIEAAVARAADQGAEALLMRHRGTAGNDPLLAATAARYHLPSSAVSRSGVEAGALMTYDMRIADQQRRVAEYVDRILRGANPGDLPIQLPDRFDLILSQHDEISGAI